ncbi:MAG: TIR domain-containing protein [Chitinophagales bacterium]
MKDPINIFLSYAKEDKSYKDKLLKHLSSMIRRNKIDVWDNERIAGGQNWKEEIERKLRTAQVAILLVSSDFLASDFINDFEIPILLERGKKGEVKVVPILIRSAYFQGSELSNFQGFPRSGKPISNWQHEDEAWISVVGGLVEIIGEKEKEVLNAAPQKQVEKVSGVAKIKTLIKDLKFAEALDELDLIATEKNDKNFTLALDMIQIQWKQISRNSISGIMSHQEEQLERNQIMHSLLSLLNDNF